MTILECALCGSDSPQRSGSGDCCNFLCRGCYPPFPKYLPEACECQPNGVICAKCALGVTNVGERDAVAFEIRKPSY